MNTFVKSASLAATAILLASCAPKYFQGEIHPGPEDRPLKEIAVIPFQEGIPGSLAAGDKAALQQLQSARIEPQGGRLISDLFKDSIEKTGRFSLRPETAVAAAVERLQPELHSLSPREGALRVGTELGVDAVLFGSVLAFEERKGSAVAVDRPAKVGFAATLIGIPDGDILWNGKYFERQESLTENMANLFLFWERSGRWLTAAELAKYGVEQALKTWPPAREGNRNPEEHSS